MAQQVRSLAVQARGSEFKFWHLYKKLGVVECMPVIRCCRGQSLDLWDLLAINLDPGSVTDSVSKE